MVRFTDIMNLGEDRERDQGSSRDDAGDERLWFTNTELIGLDKERSTPEPGEPGPGDSKQEEAASCYEKLLEKQREVSEKVKRSRGISPSPVLPDLHHIIQEGLINELYDYACLAPTGRPDLEAHIVAVTCGSMKMGKGLEYDMRGLLKLGLAAFFENVGMYRIPEEVLKKTDRLNREEMEIIRRHPEISYEIISSMGKQYGWLAEIALQVHERADGSGYPRGLSGKEILEEASIIGLMDTYVSLISDRWQRRRFIQPDAVRHIVTREKNRFPPRILKVFLGQISLFPVGTIVKLNNKYI
ncbi:MAG: HD domain-containing protein, partial [Deltaproteobacteria bacterium]|nr:HD domain-containing protein [Deltaproteobacteria bacterium]